MYMLPFLYFVIIILIRSITSYHPRQLFRHYILILSPAAAFLLIRQLNPLTGIRIKHEYRNRMSLAGLILYILFFLSVITHIVLLTIEPLGPADITINTRMLYLHAGTQNDAIVILSSMILLGLTALLSFLNMLPAVIQQKKASGRKFTIVLYSFFIILFFVFIVIMSLRLIRILT